jgi:SNF2 family DNA or RNA helicase
MTASLIFDNEEDRISVIAGITKKIDDVKNKIALITERIHDNDVCSICFDDIETKTITKCCQNPFCFKCIHIWLSKKAVCPLCKTRMTSTDVFVVSDKNDLREIKEEEIIDDNEFNEKFDKWKNFEILLKKKKNCSKILIFSNYDNTFSNIIPVLNENQIKWDFVKGNGPQINSIVNKYKGDELEVLLVNAKHYATGMNLENTTDIVMFDQFDDLASAQIIGRAHRFGRVAPLHVHYLLYANQIR